MFGGFRPVVVVQHGDPLRRIGVVAEAYVVAIMVR